MADLNFSMLDPPTGHRQTHSLGCAEDLLVEFDSFRRAFNDQIRCDAGISTRDCFYVHKILSVVTENAAARYEDLSSTEPRGLGETSWTNTKGSGITLSPEKNSMAGASPALPTRYTPGAAILTER